MNVLPPRDDNVHIELQGAIRISWAAQVMCELTMRLGYPMRFRFNNIDIWVEVNDSPQRCVAEFQKKDRERIAK